MSYLPIPSYRWRTPASLQINHLLRSTLFCETRVMVVNSCRPGFVSLDRLLKSQELQRPCPSGGHSLIEKVNNETMVKHTIVGHQRQGKDDNGVFNHQGMINMNMPHHGGQGSKSVPSTENKCRSLKLEDVRVQKMESCQHKPLLSSFLGNLRYLFPQVTTQKRLSKINTCQLLLQLNGQVTNSNQ